MPVFMPRDLYETARKTAATLTPMPHLGRPKVVKDELPPSPPPKVFPQPCSWPQVVVVAAVVAVAVAVAD